jgi:hypothetical protein
MPDDLHHIIERSLARFLSYVRKHQWYGRENEAVNLYAFGFLQKECTPSGPLKDPTQIGIEVGAGAAPAKGENARVRKDLVVWPQPVMNCWFPQAEATNKPLAVLEWKVRRPNAQAPRGVRHDFDWLTKHSAGDAQCLGYSVELNLATKPPSLAVMRFCNGESRLVEFR